MDISLWLGCSIQRLLNLNTIFSNAQIMHFVKACLFFLSSECETAVLYELKRPNNAIFITSKRFGAEASRFTELTQATVHVISSPAFWLPIMSPHYKTLSQRQQPYLSSVIHHSIFHVFVKVILLHGNTGETLEGDRQTPKSE